MAGLVKKVTAKRLRTNRVPVLLQAIIYAELMPKGASTSAGLQAQILVWVLNQVDWPALLQALMKGPLPDADPAAP